jgi:hypothetical protein
LVSLTASENTYAAAKSRASKTKVMDFLAAAAAAATRRPPFVQVMHRLSLTAFLILGAANGGGTEAFIKGTMHGTEVQPFLKPFLQEINCFLQEGGDYPKLSFMPARLLSSR